MQRTNRDKQRNKRDFERKNIKGSFRVPKNRPYKRNNFGRSFSLDENETEEEYVADDERPKDITTEKFKN